MPKRSHSSLDVRSPLECEFPFVDVLSKLRMVQRECRQLRARVENVAHGEVIGIQETGLTEITPRQDAVTTRMDWIGTYFNAIAQDQNNVAESNPTLWDNVR